MMVVLVRSTMQRLLRKQSSGTGGLLVRLNDLAMIGIGNTALGKKTNPQVIRVMQIKSEMMDNILIAHALALQKLKQFRRHPDWHKAFEQVLTSGRFLTTLPDGTRGIMEKDFPALNDAVDQQFIDNNIRSEPLQPLPGGAPLAIRDVEQEYRARAKEKK